MTDILLRIEGRAGRATLNRPAALNALTAGMAADLQAALGAWRKDPAVALVLIDAAGDRAFCAGGDIADLYATGRAGDFGFGQRFWADEYRLNATIAEYPKPVISLMQGFTMGGGVGVGCHAAVRVVGTTSQIAMPECGIGLVPDVGGSLLLARAPGRMGDYLGLTTARMGPGDAIRAGFADAFVPEAGWPALIVHLGATGEVDLPVHPRPDAPLFRHAIDIDALFAAPDLPTLIAGLQTAGTDFAAATLKSVLRNSPLSMAATLALLPRLRGGATIRDALVQEYRFTARAMEHGDFLEGIRAAIIDKDRAPRWRHAATDDLTAAVAAMLAPLPRDWTFDDIGEERT